MDRYRWKSHLSDRIKQGFDSVNSTVWMHYMQVKKAHGKRARWKLHNNAACCFEQLKEATPRKQHLFDGHFHPISQTVQLRRTRHAGHCWKKKDEFISGFFKEPLDITSVDRPARTYINFLRTLDIIWSTGRERWQRGRKIRAVSATWGYDESHTHTHTHTHTHIYIYIYIQVSFTK